MVTIKDGTIYINGRWMAAEFLANVAKSRKVEVEQQVCAADASSDVSTAGSVPELVKARLELTQKNVFDTATLGMAEGNMVLPSMKTALHNGDVGAGCVSLVMA